MATAGAVLRPIGSSRMALGRCDLTHLLGNDEAVIFVADHQGIRQAFQALQSLLGLLQQRVVTIAA